VFALVLFTLRHTISLKEEQTHVVPCASTTAEMFEILIPTTNKRAI